LISHHFRGNGAYSDPLKINRLAQASKLTFGGRRSCPPHTARRPGVSDVRAGGSSPGGHAIVARGVALDGTLAKRHLIETHVLVLPAWACRRECCGFIRLSVRRGREPSLPAGALSSNFRRRTALLHTHGRDAGRPQDRSSGPRGLGWCRRQRFQQRRGHHGTGDRRGTGDDAHGGCRASLSRPRGRPGSAGAIAKFPVLSGVEALIILAGTGGGASERAVRACFARWSTAGREVLCATSVIGGDLNEALMTA
jgi:hypothetical protein